MWDNMFSQAIFEFLTINNKIQNKPKHSKEEFCFFWVSMLLLLTCNENDKNYRCFIVTFFHDVQIKDKYRRDKVFFPVRPVHMFQLAGHIQVRSDINDMTIEVISSSYFLVPYSQ